MMVVPCQLPNTSYKHTHLFTPIQTALADDDDDGEDDTVNRSNRIERVGFPRHFDVTHDHAA